MVQATQCSACGHVNAIAAETCASCGASLPAPPRSPSQALIVEPALRKAAEPAPVAVTPDDETAALRGVAERMTRRRLAADAAAPAVPAARPAHYAGFVIRLVALLIDVGVLAAFAVPLSMAIVVGVRIGLVAGGDGTGFLDTEEALGPLVGIAWLVMSALYFATLHRGTGQTVGKGVVGIAVRRARTFARIGVVRSCVRVVGYALSTAVFFLGFLTIIANPRKRGWHDYLAGTCVVHLAPEEV